MEDFSYPSSPMSPYYLLSAPLSPYYSGGFQTYFPTPDSDEETKLPDEGDTAPMIDDDKSDSEEETGPVLMYHDIVDWRHQIPIIIDDSE